MTTFADNRSDEESGPDASPDEPAAEAKEAPAAAAPDAAAGEAESEGGGEGEPDEALDPVADLEAKLNKTKAQLLRVAADFDNFRKRSRRDMTDAAQRAKADVLREMLDGVDDLERALASGGTLESLLDGIKMVLKQFATKLERFDVRPVEAVGKPFDPAIHEAFQQRETDEYPPGVVVDAFRQGYTIGEQLLRPALVVVAKAPADAAGDPATDSGDDGATDGDAGDTAPDPESPATGA